MLVLTLVGGGVVRAEHTAADARRTTARLETLRREAYAPPKQRAPKLAAKSDAKSEANSVARAEANSVAKVEANSATKADVTLEPKTAARKSTESDAMWSLIGHAMAIPFDAREREAHFRDIPTTPAQIDAHLKRLDAALAAKHR
ncbi:MAG: hypothetical protein JWN44_5191 [Myxococcales bacterium]|nr:hypothetical protein [Myxococcales bacterium]